MENTEEHFTMTKIKFSDFLGLEVNYRENVEHDDGSYELEKTVKSGIQRHSDIDVQKDALKIHLARAFGLLAVGLYKPEKDMSKSEKSVLEMLMEKIKIQGIQVSGTTEKGNRTVVIIAQRQMFGKKVANLITCPIKLNDDTDYEFFYELDTIVDEIEREAYRYVFKGKFAQLDLFTNNGADGDSEDKKDSETKTIESKLEDDKDNFFDEQKVEKAKVAKEKKELKEKLKAEGKKPEGEAKKVA